MKFARRLPRTGHFTSISVFLCLALALVCATGAWGQTSTVGTVVGVVNDESNAAVPGAEVKLTDTSTNVAQTTVSNADGRYAFSSVTPGAYNISFSKQGFTTYQVNSQTVQLGVVLTINATMKVGSTSTTVQVTASAGAELQTMNATVGNTLNTEAMLVLPNLGRDATSLAILQPGTAPGGQAAGSAGDLNTYQLDGANVTDDMGGNVTTYNTNFNGLGGTQTNATPSSPIPTPTESIEEFRVAVSNQTSDFNNSSGAQIQMATKRGTNQFHGAGYGYYFDTTVGAANTWAHNHTSYTFGSVSLPYTPLISNHRDRFGGAIGGPITPRPMLGSGKWYFFFNYEGLRFPNVSNYSTGVPSPLMRAGVIQVPNAAGVYTPYNLNPNPVTVNGVTYQPAVCPAGACDPRGIGISPIVQQIWNKEVPLPDSPLSAGDLYNTQGYLGSIRAPINTNNYVGRIDHDFSEKEHFYVTYRDYKLVSLTTNQTDIGGVFSGDTLGTPAPKAPRPQQPSLWAAGLTSTITPTTTNTFVFSYLRNFWQWTDQSGPPQLPGLGGAVNIGGESTTGAGIIPYNVNSQSIRQRFWDGQDKGIKDDLSMLKGNHLFAFGGAYQRNFDYHSRSDNGQGVNNSISYETYNSGFNWTSPSIQYIPTTVPSAQYSSYESLYSEVLGMVASTQVAYTRKGSQLNLQPLGSNATDKSIIPYYSVYFDDTWHVKPSFTINYGLGWNLEMPPYEISGAQVALVDSNNQQININDFVAQRETAALNGTSYTPQIGFSLVRNVGAGLKYPYNPYYGEFSPRASFAWNPHYTDGLLGKMFGTGKTVVRGGYGRIFGRLNGVDLVLVPLLSPGFLQGVVCSNPLMNGSCGGPGVATPATAWRVGPDGLVAPLAQPTPTLPQPYTPGLNGYPEAVDTSALDPNFKPVRTDNFSVTIQRELNSHMQIEAGYIGKIIRHDFLEEDLDSVPYMTTVGGQNFAQAYAQLYLQGVMNSVQRQQHHRAALLRGGPGRQELRVLHRIFELHCRGVLEQCHRHQEHRRIGSLAYHKRRQRLDAGPHHDQPGRSGQSQRTGHCGQSDRQQRLGELQRRVPHFPDQQLARPYHAFEFHLGPRTGHRVDRAGVQQRDRALALQYRRQLWGPGVRLQVHLQPLHVLRSPVFPGPERSDRTSARRLDHFSPLPGPERQPHCRRLQRQPELRLRGMGIHRWRGIRQHLVLGRAGGGWLLALQRRQLGPLQRLRPQRFLRYARFPQQQYRLWKLDHCR